MVQLIHEPGVNKGPIHKSPLPRISRNIPKLSLEILSVANPVFVKARLPDLSAKLCPNLV